MKIHAAQRLNATKEIEDRTLKTVLGVDGELVKLTHTGGIYKLNDSLDTVLKKMYRFGKAQTGRKGDINMWVWQSVPGMDLVLYEHPDKTLILEVDDKD